MKYAALLVLAAACGDNVVGEIGVVAPDEFAAPIAEMIKLTPKASALHVGPSDGIQITVVQDGAIPAEGYRIDKVDDAHYNVDARDVLGAQYGVAAALENLGYSFRHPFDPEIPSAPVDHGLAGVVHTPELRVRGMHFHTLHPIEGHFAFWEPSTQSTYDAHRIIDWVIKNRGNFIQWAALRNILQDQANYDAWLPFTQELISYAHMRGVRVGIDFELFGSGDLQLAFDLVPEQNGDIPAQIAANFPKITQNLPFDVYDLSFGEFFGADPTKFISSVNAARDALRTLSPNAEMHALIHDGYTQRVDYMGQNLIYYFLVQFADQSIIPDIHTTFFYNLFEPADGAYQHPDFSEHRAYLESRACANPVKPVAYHPEDAYWVAFDVSVPQFFPLYVKSRWLDTYLLETMDGCKLDEELIFSSGFEWGYWLNDVTSLRAQYDRYASANDLITEQLGSQVGEIVSSLADLQHQALMQDKLAPYLAGRDVSIDTGRNIGIISQPDRVLFEDLTGGKVDPSTVEQNVLTPLQAYADGLDQLAFPEGDSRWLDELRDGLAVDQIRAKFSLATYRAVIAHLRGDDGEAMAQEATATQLLTDVDAIVQHRHANLHDDHGRRLLDKGFNDTFYQYGYLHQADVLCYWHRELDQVAGILGNQTEMPPGCLF